MKFKLLTFVFIAILSQILFAEESENLICENAAGECKYREGSNDIQCICADQEKNAKGYAEDGADAESCKSTLEEICGAEVPPASEICETEDNLELCKTAFFVIGNCFGHGYTQEDVDEFEDGGWNKYSRSVTGCCYILSRNETAFSYYEDARDCFEEKGCEENCLEMDNTDSGSDDESTTEQDDSSNETDNSGETGSNEESENSDSDGCSVLMI